ncbi:hypothetical protein BDC45DRAFT_572992 [Circinella umbellata]|nr:hypothetical protein BDC45DRAFT_572992 [Circinella umbellata]
MIVKIGLKSKAIAVAFLVEANKTKKGMKFSGNKIEADFEDGFGNLKRLLDVQPLKPLESNPYPEVTDLFFRLALTTVVHQLA